MSRSRRHPGICEVLGGHPSRPPSARSLPRYLWVPSGLLDHDLKRIFAHFEERRLPVSALEGNGVLEEGAARGGVCERGCHPVSPAAPVLAPPGRWRPAESRRLPRSLRAGQRGREVSPAEGSGAAWGCCATPAPTGGPSAHPPGAWRLCCWGAAGPACWPTPPSCPPSPTSSSPTSSCGRSACPVSGGWGSSGDPPPTPNPGAPLTPCPSPGAAADDKWLSALEGTRWLDHVR